MKIIYIYRKKKFQWFSIEILFKSISDEVRKSGVDVVDYELGQSGGPLRDFYKLWLLKGDIYHITGDVNYWIPFLPWGKTVLTVHDVNHYLFSLTGLKRFLYKIIWFSLPIYFARKITAVSAETKKMLINAMGASPDKIEIVHNCYSPIFKYSPKFFNRALPRILQVGSSSHKNLCRVIGALKGIPCLLSIIGLLSEEVKSELKIHNINYENHVSIDQKILFEEYKRSDIIVFVSTREGFGLPILEAQALGRALLTSNIEPMLSIAGDGACVANPFNEFEIRQMIMKMLNDNLYRDSVISSGLRNVEKYTALNMSKKFLELYLNLVKKCVG